MATSVQLEISGEGVKERVALSEGSAIVGRGPTSTILLNHPQVSRKHAEIRLDAGGPQIADQGSANGTRLNGVEIPVKEWQGLRSGDRVDVGPFSILVHEAVAPGGDAQATVVAEGPKTVIVSPGASTAVVLQVVTPRTGSREYRLTESRYTLGRSADNDIVIDDPAVSRLHARLERRGDGYEIVDEGSTNGIAIGDEKFASRLLRSGDVLALGPDVRLAYRAGASALEPTRGPSIDLRRKQEVVLGRGVGGTGEVNHPQVSRLHARVVNVGGQIVIEDAGSAQGTFVNGTRVDRQTLQEGDNVRLGGQSWLFRDGQLQAPQEEDLTLEAVELRRVVGKGTTILQDVSLSVNAREFVAIVGPSGAGKSTLITALCGYQQATSGSVLINGTDFYSHLDAFRSDVGFVPQDDIIHKDLSIERAFTYAARLRMTRDTQPYEREQRIKEVIDELDLGPHAQTPVRQLSGGQRKRVSIGVELLTRPSLLFLDEATTGLDPGIETQMMKLFRQLADNGRIVVLVTHATKNVMICDKVAFMSKGGYLAFYGPPEEALTYFGTKEFDEIYLRLEEEEGKVWGDRFHAYSHRFDTAGQPERLQAEANTKQAWAAPVSQSPIGQFVTLTSRSLETLIRSPKDLAVLLALAPFLGVLNFALWKPQTFDRVEGDITDGLNMFFMLTIVTLLVGSLGSVREIVKEQAIYRREHMVCVQVVPYVFSKLTMGFLYALYSSAALFIFQVLAVDFSYLGTDGVVQLYIPVFLATMSGVTLGLLVSAISPTEERAMLLIIAAIIPQFLLSGGILPIKDMAGLGPYVTMPATAKWAFASLLTTAKVKDGPCVQPNLDDCHIPGLGKFATDIEKQSQLHSLDRYGGIFDVNLNEYWFAMVALISIATLLVIIVQKTKDAA
ncbi:MAG: FHA domain-containing protein [Dehalococcoidia bacterium]